MAKLSKDELKAKIDTYEIPDETKISLLEDIEDSVDVVEDEQSNEYESKYNELVEEHNKLMERYKSRFLEKAEDTKEDEDEFKEQEQEEEKIVDIKEI